MTSPRGFFQQSSNNIFVNPEEIYPPSPSEQPPAKRPRGNKDGVLPWRKPAYRRQMFTTLSRLIIFHAAHIGNKKEKSDNWDKVNADLWKQDIFKDYPRVEIRQVKTSWQTWVKDRVRFHAWDKGIPANNSNLAGDLDEADKNLLIILTEEEAQKEKARALKADKEIIEKNEITLVTEGISEEAKKKRKTAKQLGTREPISSVTNTSSCSYFDIGAAWKSIMDSPQGKAATASMPPSTPMETKTLQKFQLYFQWKSDKDMLIEAGIEESEDNFKSIRTVGIDIFLNIFCAREKRFEQSYVLNEFRMLVPPLFAAKMYVYLHKLLHELEKAEHVSDNDFNRNTDTACLYEDYDD